MHTLPMLEGLESRLLMSGDVVVKFSGGRVRIFGDAADNSIYISDSGSGLRVNGDGTTQFHLNSLAAAPSLNLDLPGYAHVSVKAGDGNDTVLVENLGTSTFDLAVNLGDGDDIFTTNMNVQWRNVSIQGKAGLNTIRYGQENFNSAIWGKLAVSAGSGDDSVQLWASVQGKVSIKAGAGTNNVLLASGSVAQMTASSSVSIVTGNGNDTISMLGYNDPGGVANVRSYCAGRLTVNGGAGDDLIVLGQRSTLANGVKLLGGAGNDSIYFGYGAATTEVAVMAYIDAGAGNDQLDVWYGISDDAAVFKLGSGQDLLRFTNANISVSLFADGGSGTNTYTDMGGNILPTDIVSRRMTPAVA